EEQVPEWFRYDPARPYAIFDAWRELSTRKAMVCLGENWQVLAGQLQNERGEPIPNSPIHISHYTGIRGYGVGLQTDGSGHFVVYSPYTLEFGQRDPENEIGILNGCFVSAAPGFPNSHAGAAFAAKCKASRQCKTQLVRRDGERAYYVFACSDNTPFDR